MVKNLIIEKIRKEKVFKVEDKILFDINEFKDISCFCYEFGLEFLSDYDNLQSLLK